MSDLVKVMPEYWGIIRAWGDWVWACCGCGNVLLGWECRALTGCEGLSLPPPEVDPILYDARDFYTPKLRVSELSGYVKVVLEKLLMYYNLCFHHDLPDYDFFFFCNFLEENFFYVLLIWGILLGRNILG